MIPENWLKDYYKRAGETDHCRENMTVNEHGFCSWKFHDDHLAIHDCYGDGEYWQERMIKLAKEKGLDKICFATRRNPKTYERKYGYKTIAYLMELKL